MLKPKAIVSACLLGEMCRYDGACKEHQGIFESLDGYEVISFCPEAPLFGTPRERISVVMLDGVKHIITDESGRDVTQMLQDEIESFLQKYPDVKRVLLKSKSPSCGIASTPMRSIDGEVIGYGNGIAADIVLKKYPHAIMSDENF